MGMRASGPQPLQVEKSAGGAQNALRGVNVRQGDMLVDDDFDALALKAVTLAALKAHVDWEVLTVPCDGNKRPLLKDWPEARYTTDDAVIAAFESCGAQLVGALTGSASGLFVIDVDPKGGGLARRASARARSPTHSHHPPRRRSASVVPNPPWLAHQNQCRPAR